MYSWGLFQFFSITGVIAGLLSLWCARHGEHQRAAVSRTGALVFCLGAGVILICIAIGGAQPAGLWDLVAAAIFCIAVNIFISYRLQQGFHAKKHQQQEDTGA